MPEKQNFYLLNLFKVKGHVRWRVHVTQNSESFKRQVEDNTEVIEKKTYKLDRITGEISPLN